MPYKSEKLKIEGTSYDRRVKLTTEQKNEIVRTRNEYGLSYNKLAKEFKVSKRLVYFICNPDKLREHRERHKELRKDGRYYDREKHREEIKSTRRYKQDLYNKGKIKPI